MKIEQETRSDDVQVVIEGEQALLIFSDDSDRDAVAASLRLLREDGYTSIISMSYDAAAGKEVWEISR